MLKQPWPPYIWVRWKCNWPFVWFIHSPRLDISAGVRLPCTAMTSWYFLSFRSIKHLIIFLACFSSHRVCAFFTALSIAACSYPVSSTSGYPVLHKLPPWTIRSHFCACIFGWIFSILILVYCMIKLLMVTIFWFFLPFSSWTHRNWAFHRTKTVGNSLFRGYVY